MKLTKSDVKIEDVTKRGIVRRSLTGIAIISGLSMTSCADDKTCSDYDTSADPYVYDTGTYADPSDYGGDSDTGVADPNGRGSRCADYD